MGSKNRHAKYLIPIITNGRKENQYVVDLFCGGYNLIDKIKGNRIANDIHFYLIEFFKTLVSGWIPPTFVSEQEYVSIRDSLKNNNNFYPNYLIGYVGFNLSFGGRWFAGYRRDKQGKRTYSLEAYTNVMKQKDALQGIEFENKHYIDVAIPDNSILYCDPPYMNTTSYKDSIDYTQFWLFCREMSERGHKIFISEYSAPDDFVCVWQKEVASSLSQDTGSKRNVEKLFIPVAQMKQSSGLFQEIS